jgi:hypothetical protein
MADVTIILNCAMDLIFLSFLWSTKEPYANRTL